LSIYPQYKWSIYRFKTLSLGFWKEKKYQKLFLQQVGRNLGYNSFEDWYNIKIEEILQYGGRGLLDYCNGSPIKALLSNFTDYKWLPWKFTLNKNLPKGIWDDDHYESDYLHNISKLIGISKLDDWYRVSREDLIKYHAITFLQKRGGLIKVLSKVYPNHLWYQEKFSSREKKCSQWWLYKIIKKILPENITVVEEYSHPHLTYSTGFAMVFDVYIPTLCLAFEYQGIHHYQNHYIFGSAVDYKKRDIEKKLKCQSLGITLIEVPYWWKRDMESIKGIMHKWKPDILSQLPSESNVIPKHSVLM